MNDPRPERFPAGILTALLFLLPLLHASGLADPFALPRSMALAVAALLLVLHAAIRAARGAAPPSAPRALILLGGGLVAAGAIAAATSFNRGLAMRGAFDLACLLVVAWSASGTAREPGVARRLFGVTLAASTLVAAGVLAQVLVPGYAIAFGPLSILPPSSAGGSFGDPGLAAQWLVLSLPIGLGLVALSRGPARLMAAFGVGAIVSALVFAGGPESWIAGGIVVVVAIAARVAQALLSGDGWNELASELDGSALRAAAVVILTVTLAVALARLPGLRSAVPIEPMTHVGLLAPTSGEPSTDRRAAVRGTAALVTMHPVGVGPGLFRHAFLEVAWTRVPASPFTLAHQAVHAGNGFLELAAEAGIAGGLLFALLMVTAIQGAWRAAVGAPSRRSIGLVLTLALLNIAIVGILGSPFQEAAPAALVFVVIGLALPATGAGGPTARRPLAIAAMVVALAIAAVALPWYARRAAVGRASLEAQSFLAADDAAAAVAALERPEILAAPDPLPLLIDGNALARRKDYARAAERFGAVLERSPWFLAARLGRAGALQELGHYDRAADELEAARALWPQSAGTAMAMARLDERRGRLDAARAGYQSASALDPAQAEPWVAMGELDIRRGRNEAALEAFRRAAALNPRQPRVNVLIGDALERQGYLELAVGFYQKAATLEAASLEPRLRLANALHALGRECEARESIQAAREIETDPKRRAGLDGLIDQLEPACRAETAKKKP